MDPQQQFCLKWNSFGNNLVNTFETLFKSESLTDVTLFCEGVTFKAHKIILAACSKHFQDLFEAAPFCPNILVILDGTSSTNMSALLEFMYKGEVHVSQECLTDFLKAAGSLQIKGLTLEHERLVNQNNVRGVPVTEMRPIRSNSTSSSTGKPISDNGDAEGMHPPSTTTYPSILPPYLPNYRGPLMFEQRHPNQSGGGGQVPPPAPSSPYDHPPPRKRHQRSPSDSSQQRSQRDSVLKTVGNHPERESPRSNLNYSSPLPSPHEYTVQQFHARDREPQSNEHLETPGNLTLPFSQTERDGTVAVESQSPNSSTPTRSSPDWRSKPPESSSNCAEDLRIKTEPRETNHRGESNSRIEDNQDNSSRDRDREREWRDRESSRASENSERNASNTKTSVPHNPQAQAAPVPPPPGSNLTPWNPTTYSTNQEISDAHKRAISTTTPTGKKLQCPYCERLYGYETNLRAHIRQRHQGIRAPCPYCTRTFTRNNTVRRHIAREHKNEMSLKAFQLSQVQNHNQ